MTFINLEQLPFVGMSYEFIGDTQGAPFSAYIVKAKPGQGPPLHKHPYVEVAFTLGGCATITVGDEQREMKAGDLPDLRVLSRLRIARQHRELHALPLWELGPFQVRERYHQRCSIRFCSGSRRVHFVVTDCCRKTQRHNY